MITCLVIDDEQSAIDVLTSFIARVPFLTLGASTTDPVEGLNIIQKSSIDLVFLDIHMPKISGMDFIRVVKGQTRVILTTAYSEFAVQGFEQDALDYLLKPISFDRFLQAAQKAMNAFAQPSARWQPAEQAPNYIYVKTESKGKMTKINFDDIIYVEGLKNYLSIFTAEERIITLLNMKDLEDRLPSQSFMRVHKSYIVSLEKIKALDGNQILFKEVKGYVPLGETYRTAFFDTLQKNVMAGKK